MPRPYPSSVTLSRNIFLVNSSNTVQTVVWGLLFVVFRRVVAFVSGLLVWHDCSRLVCLIVALFAQWLLRKFVASLLFLGTSLNMMHDDLSRLSAIFKKTDEMTIRELIRQSELFLEAQLTASIAADQRSITFASILIAAATLLIGLFGQNVRGANQELTENASLLLISFSLISSAAIAIFASRQTNWSYSGNNPRKWIEDINKNTNIKNSLCDQLALYTLGIERNLKSQKQHGCLMNYSYAISFIGSIIFIFGEVGLIKII